MARTDLRIRLLMSSTQLESSCPPRGRAHSVNHAATALHDPSLPPHKCAQLSRESSRNCSSISPEISTSHRIRTASSRLRESHSTVRTILAAAPSFLSQNTRTYRVIRRQETDAVGLKTGSKTTMAGNRTAITSQSVSGLSSARRVAVPKHIAQRRHCSLRCTM